MSMGLIDRSKVIKELESLRDICNAKSNMAIGKGKVAWAGYANATDDALTLLKELPVWHVFNVREPDKDEKKEHPDWKWVMESDLTPKHGEEFLWYRRSINCFVIDSWNDDMWEEYCSTADGETIEAGDAWMELPHPPMEECE